MAEIFSILTHRIIPVLLIQDNRVVRSIQFEHTVPIGSPISQAKILNANEADEIILLNIGKSDLIPVLKQVSNEVFVPLTVGGGIDSVERIRELLNAGADKVVLSTHAVLTPNLISEAVRVFGSQCISVCIDYEGNRVRVNHGRLSVPYTPSYWAKRVVELGAGEIILHSIQRQGTMQGYDLEILQQVKTEVPVVILGGAGKLTDFEDAINAGASGMAASSIFTHTDQSPIKVKTYLRSRGYNVRELVGC